jgi:hypothetical protein
MVSLPAAARRYAAPIRDEDHRQRLTAKGRALDTPVVPAAVAAVTGTAFAFLRLAVVARDNVSRFVFAGSNFVRGSKVPPGIHVFRGTGYDGQFYYRLALDPLDLSRSAFGITWDQVFRVERIGYPALSWLAAAGNRSLIPNTEVAVNLAALSLLGWMGGVLAAQAGRHAAWGILVVGFWGFLFSIGRDLPEVVARCFMVGGLLVLRRGRPVVAGLLLAGAVLTLETTFDFVVAVALVDLLSLVRHHRRPSHQEAAWIIPGLAFGAWQLFAWFDTSMLPLRSGGGDNLAAPVIHMIGALGHYLQALPSTGAAIWLGEFAALVAMVVVAASAVRTSAVPTWERAAWVVALVLALCLSQGIWYGRADFRAFEDLYLFSTILLLGSRLSFRALWIPAGLVSAMWVVTFVHRVIRL